MEKGNKNKNKNNKLPETGKVIGDPYRYVPKYCTSINFGVLPSKQIVLTLLYQENQQDPTLIERVVVDLEHAQKIVEVLGDVLKKVKDETTITTSK